MSFQASAYAREICQGNTELSTAAKFVLYVLGERAHHQTGIVYCGDWIASTTGYRPQSTRRAVAELVAAGYLGVVERRPGRATVARFPVISKLSTTRSSRSGSDNESEHPRAPTGARPAPPGARPAPGGARTGVSTGQLTKSSRFDSGGQFHPVICGCEECNQLRDAQ